MDAISVTIPFTCPLDIGEITSMDNASGFIRNLRTTMILLIYFSLICYKLYLNKKFHFSLQEIAASQQGAFNYFDPSFELEIFILLCF
jgi:hypothetical protein